jgi:hypothetical protein
MTREERKAQREVKRLAIDANFRKSVAENYPQAVIDDEGRAAYWTGHFYRFAELRKGGTRKPKGPEGYNDPNYQWRIDVPNALQILLKYQPPSGFQHRMLGELDGGVLRIWRSYLTADGHEHPVLKCYTIARYPIVRAEEFGFQAIQVNEGGPLITVEALLEMPEVPTKYRHTFERQIQIVE